MSDYKKYKGLVAFDLDHTLLDHNTWKITPSTLESIEKLKAKDYLVIIASGRDMKNKMSIGYLREVDPDALIHMNGTMVEVRDKVLMDRLMDKALLKRILTYCSDKKMPIGCRINEIDYFINHEEVMRFDKNYFGIYQGRNFQDPWELMNLPVRSLAFYGSRERSEVLQGAFPELNVMPFSKNFGADVVEAAYSKARGIDRLCEYFDIGKQDTYAFGDSLNDIEMLRMVNMGVAMGNAQDEAKAAADYVTDNIDEDGIKNALVHFGLI